MRGILLVLGSVMLMVCSAGCQKQAIHPDTRVWVGLSLTDTCQVSSWLGQLKVLQQAGVDGIMIDLHIEPSATGPAAGFYYYLPHPMDSVVRQLEKYQFPFGVRISLSQDSIPISSARIDDWFTDLSGLLLRSSQYPPAWIMFSGPWTSPGWKKDVLKSFFRTIRKDWEAFDGEIWVQGENPKFKLKAADPAGKPDAFVQEIHGFPTKQEIQQVRRLAFEHENPSTKLRVISLAPAWSGLTWRIKPWIIEQEGLAEVRDILISGRPCKPFPSIADLNKLKQLRTMP